MTLYNFLIYNISQRIFPSLDERVKQRTATPLGTMAELILNLVVFTAQLSKSVGSFGGGGGGGKIFRETHFFVKI